MKKGFTLIELMTALSIFLIIMTVSMGSIISILEANRKSRSLKTALNSLNTLVESMSREMRYGKNYHCGSGDYQVPQNCPSGDTIMRFTTSDGGHIAYRLYTSGSLTGYLGKYVALSGDPVSPNPSYLPSSPTGLVIDNLTFYTLGAGTSDTLQPKVIIIIKSHIGKDEGRVDLTLQTLVSQRTLDI